MNHPANRLERMASLRAGGKGKVAVVPGEPFGSDIHIRLSYATAMEAIERGLTRIDAALRRLS